MIDFHDDSMKVLYNNLLSTAKWGQYPELMMMYDELEFNTRFRFLVGSVVSAVPLSGSIVYLSDWQMKTILWFVGNHINWFRKQDCIDDETFRFVVSERLKKFKGFIDVSEEVMKVLRLYRDYQEQGSSVLNEGAKSDSEIKLAGGPMTKVNVNIEFNGFDLGELKNLFSNNNFTPVFKKN